MNAIHQRFAVFVDAGYFFAAGAYALTASQPSRRHVSLYSPADSIRELADRAAHSSGTGSQLLRIYWYDAMLGSGLSLEHSTIAHLPGVKLRLGTLNHAGEQKGVDSLIVTDLIELARNRAIADAFLVSGDEDLRIAVQIAQSFGVRVNVMGVGDFARNVSASLMMEADTVESLDTSWLRRHLKVTAAAEAVSEANDASSGSGNAGLSLEEAAMQVCESLLEEMDGSTISSLATHLSMSTTIPPEFDGKLIARTAKELGRRLSSEEMRQTRGTWVKRVRARAEDLGTWG